MKKKTGGLLVFCFTLLLIPYANARSWTFSDTQYFAPDDGKYYTLEFEAGDKVNWNFRIYSEQFQGYLYCGSLGGIMSDGEYSDSGSFTITAGGSKTLHFVNIDPIQSGYIDVSFDINPLDNISIPGYNIIFIISIIALISIQRFKKKKSVKFEQKTSLS